MFLISAHLFHSHNNNLFMLIYLYVFILFCLSFSYHFISTSSICFKQKRTKNGNNKKIHKLYVEYLQVNTLIFSFLFWVLVLFHNFLFCYYKTKNNHLSLSIVYSMLFHSLYLYYCAFMKIYITNIFQFRRTRKMSMGMSFVQINLRNRWLYIKYIHVSDRLTCH